MERFIARGGLVPHDGTDPLTELREAIRASELPLEIQERLYWASEVAKMARQVKQLGQVSSLPYHQMRWPQRPVVESFPRRFFHGR